MNRFILLLTFALPIVFSACSSTRDVKQQKYARLKKEWTYEYEFPVVWRAIEKSLEKYSIDERDPEDVTKNELKKLTERTIETKWILTQSRDKYVSYKVNQYVRKKYLQVRFKYDVEAKSVMGGTRVAVNVEEEIEQLDDDGKSAGWSNPDRVDPARASDLLDRIKLAILSDPSIPRQ